MFLNVKLSFSVEPPVEVSSSTSNAEGFPAHFSDLVGTLWDFGCPSGPVGFGKARGGCDTPLCLLSSGRQ